MYNVDIFKASMAKKRWEGNSEIILKGFNPLCGKLSVSVYAQTCKFTPKLSDLRTHLPGDQTDAEVFVKRNINISSIYEAILHLFQF